MKTKRIIYFMLIVLGAVIMAVGENYMEKEYALCVGIVLLMFGVYKSTQVWSSTNDDEEITENDNHG